MRNLVKSNEILTTNDQINIINENLKKSLLKLVLEGNFIFQQDNKTAKKFKFFSFCPNQTVQMTFTIFRFESNKKSVGLDNRVYKCTIINKNF